MWLTVLDRSIVKEIARTQVAIVAILMLILVGNRLVRFLSDAVAGRVSTDVLLVVLGLKSINYIVLILPPAFFLAAILVISRMYRDNEIAVLSAAGIGPVRVYRAVLAYAVPFALMVSLLSFFSLPWTEVKLAEVMHQQSQRNDISGIIPGRFNEYRKGDVIYYVEDYGESKGQVNHVFIQNRQQNKLGVTVAKTARQTVDQETGARYLVLENGIRFEGQPGELDYSVFEFEAYGIKIDEANVENRRIKADSIATRQLLASSDPRQLAELHWRIAVPLSVLVLSVCVLPLSSSAPRSKNYSKALLALLVYVIYFNLLGLGRSWMIKGEMPLELGLWWVHLLFFVVWTGVLIRFIGPGWLLMRWKRRGVGI